MRSMQLHIPHMLFAVDDQLGKQLRKHCDTQSEQQMQCELMGQGSVVMAERSAQRVISHADKPESMHSNSGMRISEQRMDELVLEHQQRRMSDGIAHSDRTLVRQYADGWFTALQQGSACFTRQMCIYAVLAMHMQKAARDTLILSAINDELDVQRAVHMSVNMPKGAYSREIMIMLDQAFHQDTAFDMVRGQYAIDCLAKMVCTVPRAYSDHPLAALAYILWFGGQGELAVVCARYVLDVHADNTLAQIVMKAVEHHMYPRSVVVQRSVNIEKCI